MNFTELKEAFKNPDETYRGKPFWSWNGELNEKELLRQTHILKEMGMGGFFMHSRAGLITEYLGDEWFSLINRVADEAEKEEMEAWLYDEDRWPSGSAGGKVTEDERYRMKSLVLFASSPEKYIPRENTYALYLAQIEGINLYTYRELSDLSPEYVQKAAKEAEGTEKGEWQILCFAIVPDKPESVYNGNTYIDTMSLAATKRFIELTHEEYARRCGDRLGRSIKGIFSDEPHRGHLFDNLKTENGITSCSLCWTDDMKEEFEKRYGYSFRPILPELFYRKNGEKVHKVKLHYIDLADNLFLERFAKPIQDWCREHGIQFTGHVLHEDSLMNQTVPEGSLMRFYQYMDVPGVDCLTEHNRCYWIVKQLSSAARQLGKKKMLSELYGCTGWQFDFKGHKAVGDWQALFGINLRCQHLSWYTMEGESKRDYPASILHQSPWYRDYAKVEDYFARFGLLMAQGEPGCDLLVINPIESLWCQAYIGWANWIFNASPDIETYEKRYEELFGILMGNGIDFDYGEEAMMASMASVESDGEGSPVLRVGEATYHTVLVTNMLTIRKTTLELLKQFITAGGRVVFAGKPPSYVDGERSEEPDLLVRKGEHIPFEEKAFSRTLSDVTVEKPEIIGGDGEIFIQLRRGVEGGKLLAVLNTNRDQSKPNVKIALTLADGLDAQMWDMEEGLRYDASSLTERKDGKVLLTLSLEPAESRMFFFTPQKEVLPGVKVYRTKKSAEITGEFDFTREEGNVLVLDRVEWMWKDGEKHPEKEVLKADGEVRDSIGIERRGGEMLQPWFAKKYDRKEYGKLCLTYRFVVERLPEGSVFLAGERPETNRYSINGIPLRENDSEDFWIDECFHKMPIPDGGLHLGENQVDIEVPFCRTTNIEALYLVGDFGVKIEGTVRKMTALPEKIGLGSYESYAMPFYSGNLTYYLPPEVYRRLVGGKFTPEEKIILSPSFTGGCVKVTASGKTQVLGWDPYEADVTEAVKAGESIKVTVEGTRRNLFGPLHQIPALDVAYGPGNFVTEGAAWTESYNLLPSGAERLTLIVKEPVR